MTTSYTFDNTTSTIAQVDSYGNQRIAALSLDAANALDYALTALDVLYRMNKLPAARYEPTRTELLAHFWMAWEA